MGLSDRALTWARSRAPSDIVGVAPIGGGITNTKWMLRLDRGEPLVLRWADPRVWGAVGREHVRRETLACRLLAGSSIPVPGLVAADPGGEEAGGPAALLTWRPGRTRLDPLPPEAVRALAGLAVDLHRRSVAESQRPPIVGLRGSPDPSVPDWSDRPELWRRAIDLVAAGRPTASRHGLLHGDFHFGNMVWRHDQPSGLIDWAETSWGPSDVDVAHLCSDFAMMHSAAAAEAFRAEYRRQGGSLDPDPDAARFWMVADIVGFLPDPAHILVAVQPSRPDLTPQLLRAGLEELLAVTLGAS